ncbi:MAG TPA: PHP domain-containing protein [bacterium]|nr:PHP domain-containing protein [bacterium]
MMLRMEMHLHTQYSIDSYLKLDTIIKVCQRKGINAIAVTDHGTIEGAERLREKIEKKNANIKVITGEEIFTTKGEIIGLFLKERIPYSLSPEETIRRIKEQEGLVYIPHPFIPLIANSLGEELYEFSKKIDIVEVFNARSFFRRSGKRASQFAQDNGIVTAAGSDAHFASEIGNAYMELEDFNSPQEFLRNLKEAKTIIKGRGWLFSPLSYAILFLSKIRGKDKLL